jgi:hypothetical protein
MGDRFQTVIIYNSIHNNGIITWDKMSETKNYLYIFEDPYGSVILGDNCILSFLTFGMNNINIANNMTGDNSVASVIMTDAICGILSDSFRRARIISTVYFHGRLFVSVIVNMIAEHGDLGIEQISQTFTKVFLKAA